MNSPIQQADTVHMTIELNELKAQLDRAMRQEASFQRSKQLYLQIKMLETQLHALVWHPFTAYNQYTSL